MHTKRDLIRLCKLGGLTVEGDETQEELYEAYIYLRNHHVKQEHGTKPFRQI